MRRLLTAVTFAAAMVAGVLAAPASAVTIGEDGGCTPGYWKQEQHFDSWEEADPDDIFGDIFADARANVAGLTLLEALQGGGGPGADGKALLLARAATAAYLNAANEGVEYPWRRFSNGLGGRPPLVATVNAAFASGDADVMEALATRLDNDNNGICTLT